MVMIKTSTYTCTYVAGMKWLHMIVNFSTDLHGTSAEDRSFA